MKENQQFLNRILSVLGGFLFFTTVSVYFYTWSFFALTISSIINICFLYVFHYLLQNWNKRRENRELETLQLQRELNATRSEAETANRLKSEFLANMSHEIRTPLNAIIGMADLLWETPLNSEQKKYVEIFRRAGDNLLKLINDILDISKIEAGKLNLENIEFDLQELIESVSDLMSIKAQDKFIQFQHHIEPSVPPQVFGDPTRIRQILFNLIGNAIKFTEHGNVSLNVRFDLQNPQNLIFSVKDHGHGIPKEKQHLLFQKFSQTDGSVTRKFGGTGLGLAICRSLIEQMHGSIWFESETTPGPNQGTTFFIRLPLFKNMSGSTGFRNSQRYQFKEQKVLLVTSSDFTKTLLEEIFQFWGAETTHFKYLTDFHHATFALKTDNRFDLVVSDSTVNQTDLMELLLGLTSPHSQRPPGCILVSSQQLTHIVIANDEIHPGVAYLHAPIKISELAKLSTTLLEIKHAPKKCVVFVDDEAEIRENFNQATQDKDWQIHTFSNGKEALEFCQHHKVDLIFSDLNMPIMNGMRLLENLRKSHITAPFYFCSAFADNAVLEKAKSFKINGVFEKPIGLNILVETAEQLFKSSQLINSPLPNPFGVINPSQLNILLVDDSEDNRILIRSYLKTRPYQITEAINGQEAVELFQHNNFDLIFMDMQMPVLDGYSATREIRKLENEQKRPRTPIIALTANATNEDKQKTSDAGCDDHLSKPIKKQTFLDLINAHHQTQHRSAS